MLKIFLLNKLSAFRISHLIDSMVEEPSWMHFSCFRKPVDLTLILQ